MQDEDRGKIAEKRSSLRGWRERGRKISHRGEIIGTALMILIFFAIILSSYSNDGESKSSQILDQQKNEIVLESTSFQNSIPPPGITIYSPENITYDTNTPSLNFIAAGSNLNKILVSVDGGPTIPVLHDGTIAKIDFVMLNPLFIDDFSSASEGQWTDSNSWSLEDGKYISTGGTSTFGDLEWDDYIIEAKTKIISGKDISIDFRWNGGSNHYRVQTSDSYGNLMLHKMDGKGYVTMASSKPSGIDPAGWHIWKIIVNGNKIQFFIDNMQYIDYTDVDKPYLKGKFRLRVMNANVEYDYVQVYEPLQNGQHGLTIFANNTAGKSSSKSSHFTINVTPNIMYANGGNAFGIIGLPLSMNRFEVIVKSVTAGDIYTSVWLSVKNRDDVERPFKLSPGPVILDNIGNQYESVKVTRGAEIIQTPLYANATREGAIFFDRFKEGASPERLFLYINGDKFEFIINQ